jgi:cytochrome c-type biogenesis protein CcmH
MILFWVICAALILIALAFVLPTAMQQTDQSGAVTEEERKQANIAVYRDQLSELEADLRNGIVSEEQYAQDREEIKRRLLEDTAPSETRKTATAPAIARNTAYLLGIGLPLVAVVIYLNVGTPKSISEPAMVSSMPRQSAEAPQPRSQEQIAANVEKLAKKLEANPSDAQGWTMLARSYNSMEKWSEAEGAYAKATEQSPNNADLWAEYAFATAMANDKNLEGKPMELINRALKVDPQNAKALQLAGSAAFQAKDYKKAIDYWQRILKQVPAESEVAQAITERIDEAKKLEAGK